MSDTGFVEVQQDGARIHVETDQLAADIWPVADYVSGVRAGSLVDKRTGARELGFGLDIVDFLLESDPGPADVEHAGHRYHVGDLYHGQMVKSYVELPQICTQARALDCDVAVGPGFAVVRQRWQWTEAVGSYRPGSRWEQTLVFRPGRRYFFSCDRVETVNTVGDLFLRIDLPGHLKHQAGDTFAQIYLSYQGVLPDTAFHQDFPPDERFLYRRGRDPVPERMIRAYQVRTPGGENPWLAGMNLNPRIVSEAWCHQRGYVCFIEEFGRLPVTPGDQFSMANVIGFFDRLEEMHDVYDQYRGYTSLVGSAERWALTEGVARLEGDRLTIAPQGLRPDVLTEDGWTGSPQHPDWRLRPARAWGVDTDDKVAGAQSLWFEGHGESGVEWEATGDRKDLTYYDALKFHVKADANGPWLRTQVLLSDGLNNQNLYHFDVAPGPTWQEVTIPFDAPVGRQGSFSLDRTQTVRLEFEAAGRYRLWLDNFRLESPEAARGFRLAVFP
jgi:hypothetical protein